MSEYMEAVTDEQLLAMIGDESAAAVGDWMSTSQLAEERRKSTYEYAGLPYGHLAPQGVSTIVDTSTTEVVEAYTAVITDLFLSNNKIAKFIPQNETPGAFKAAHDASMLVNHTIFNLNKGWEKLSSWFKSALLWKVGIIRWYYVEDKSYRFEEYEEIDQIKLDQILAQDNVEIVGDLEIEQDPMTGQTMFINVKLRFEVDNSRVKIENVPPESFKISANAEDIESAQFVGIETEMTRSEIRQWWPEAAANIDDWDSLGGSPVLNQTNYSIDSATRKVATGQGYVSDYGLDSSLEANREVTVMECWMRVDRDGDGIAELKHFIIAGSQILLEEYAEEVPVAALKPIDIPFEFYGLSIADLTRSSTLASTAVLRGFVENVYLTNYSPKLADPNVVDFSALQNMKPKSIIATNGNPAAAVQAMVPETISTGTVPLMEYMQTIKEQATGMSKAAQGLNDTLYVSGNSEAKLQAVQSASQKRIQHIARRFAETGIRRLVRGIYCTIKAQMKTPVGVYSKGVYVNIDPRELPLKMDIDVLLDIGENSNANKLQKLQQVAGVMGTLKENGMGMVVKPDAPAIAATQLIEAMGLEAADYLEDFSTDEFKQKAQEAIQNQQQEQQAAVALENRLKEAQAALQEANVAFTNAQAENTVTDNIRQLATAINDAEQKWAETYIKAAKEGVTPPNKPDIQELIGMAVELVNQQKMTHEVEESPQQEMGEEQMMGMQ